MVVSQTIKMAHRGSTMSKIVPLLVRWIPPFPKCHPSLNADDPPALDAHLRRLLLGIKVIGQDGGWSSFAPRPLPNTALDLTNPLPRLPSPLLDTVPDFAARFPSSDPAHKAPTTAISALFNEF